MKRGLAVNTRPRDSARSLTQALHNRGFDVLEVPATCTVPGEMAQIEDQLREAACGWMVISSPVAARLVGKTLLSLDKRPQILCGTGTARALLEIGLEPGKVLEQFSSSLAFDWLLRHAAEISTGVLVCRAEEGRSDLEAGCRRANIPVQALLLYRTQSVPPTNLAMLVDVIRENQVEVVTYCSPSAVRSVVGGVVQLSPWLMTDLRRVNSVCIGMTTAQEATNQGLAVAAIARETTVESLADAVLNTRMAA